MTMISDEKCRAVARSWVTYSMARFRSRLSRSSRLRISSRIETSSMDTGSSASSTSGLGGQRPRDRHPLPLAAGQLVRMLARDFLRRGQVDRTEQFADLVLEGWPAKVSGAQQQRPREMMRDGVHRVERGERVLEDDLDILPVVAQRPAVAASRVAVQRDPAR